MLIKKHTAARCQKTLFWQRAVLCLIWLFFITHKIGALSVNADAAGHGGILYTDDSGTITFHGANVQSELDFTSGYIAADFSFGQINASHEVFSGNLWMLQGGVTYGIQIPQFYDAAVSLHLAGGLISSKKIGIAADEKSFQNDGISGGDFYCSLPVSFNFARIGECIVEPFFCTFELSFGEGDCYYFYGKPDVPGLRFGGVSVKAGNADVKSGRHCFSGLYGTFNAALLTSENVPIADMDAWFCAGMYNVVWEKRTEKARLLQFMPSVGYAYASSDIAVYCDTTNIPDWKFLYWPYRAVNIDGFINFHTVYCGASVSSVGKIFSCSFLVAAAFFPSNSTNMRMVQSYKQNWLYDGRTVVSYPDCSNFFDNILLLCNMEATFNVKKFSICVQKKIPFLFSLGSSKETAGTSDSYGASDLSLRTVLLSGLSISLRFCGGT